MGNIIQLFKKTVIHVIPEIGAKFDTGLKKDEHGHIMIKPIAGKFKSGDKTFNADQLRRNYICYLDDKVELMQNVCVVKALDTYILCNSDIPATQKMLMTVTNVHDVDEVEKKDRVENTSKPQTNSAEPFSQDNVTRTTDSKQEETSADSDEFVKWAEKWYQTGHKVVAMKDKTPLTKWAEIPKEELYPQVINAFRNKVATQLAIRLNDGEECFDFEFFDIDAVKRLLSKLGIANIDDFYYYNTQKGFRLCYKTHGDHHALKVDIGGHPIVEINRNRLIIVPPSLPDSVKPDKMRYGEKMHNSDKYSDWKELDYEIDPADVLLTLLNCRDNGDHYICENKVWSGKVTKDLQKFIRDNGEELPITLSPKPKPEKVKVTVAPNKPPETVDVSLELHLKGIVKEEYHREVPELLTKTDQRLREVTVKILTHLHGISPEYKSSLIAGERYVNISCPFHMPDNKPSLTLWLGEKSDIMVTDWHEPRQMTLIEFNKLFREKYGGEILLGLTDYNETVKGIMSKLQEHNLSKSEMKQHLIFSLFMKEYQDRARSFHNKDKAPIGVFIYDGKRWVLQSKEAIETILWDLVERYVTDEKVKKMITSDDVEKAVKMIEARLAYPMPQTFRYVQFEDYILDVYGYLVENKPLTECLLTPSPDIYAMFYVPRKLIVDEELLKELNSLTDYSVNKLMEISAKYAPNVMSAFEDWASDDIPLLWEMFGYPLVVFGNPLEAFFLLYGDVKAGKSTYLKLLKKAYGDDNTTHFPMEMLRGRDSFEISELYGKMLNTFEELPKENYDLTVVQTLTGGAINARRKYKSTISFQVYVKFYFGTNWLPPEHVVTAGVYRRLIVAKFTGYVSNPLFKLPEDTEISKALLISLAWVKRVLMNSAFDMSLGSMMAKISTYESASIVAEFVLSMTERDPESTIERDELYEKYFNDWCIARRGKPAEECVSKNIFVAILKDLGYEHFVSTKRMSNEKLKKVTKIKGLRLKQQTMTQVNSPVQR